MTCDIPNWAINIYYSLALPFAFIAAYIILLVEHDDAIKRDHACIKWARFLGFLALSCVLCFPYLYPDFFVQTLLLLILVGWFVLAINMLSLHFRKKPTEMKQIAYVKNRK